MMDMLASLPRITPQQKWLYGDYLIGRSVDEIAIMWGISVDDVQLAIGAESKRRSLKAPKRRRARSKPSPKHKPKARRQQKAVPVTPELIDGMFRLRKVVSIVGLHPNGWTRVRNRIDDDETLVVIEPNSEGSRCRATYVTLAGLKQWRDRARRTGTIERLEAFIDAQELCDEQS